MMASDMQCKRRRYHGHEVERRELDFPIGHGFVAVVRHPRRGFVCANWHSGLGNWAVAHRISGSLCDFCLDVVLAGDIESGTTLAEARDEAGLCPRCGAIHEQGGK